MEDEASCLESLGDCYFALGKFPDAIKNYQRALKLAKKIENDFFQFTNLIKLGDANVSIAEKEEGLEYYQSALQLAKQIDNPEFIEMAQECINQLTK